MPEVPCDRAIPPPDIHKIRRQITQSFSKSPRFSAMNHFIWGSSNNNQRLWDILEISAVRVSGGNVSWGTLLYNGGRHPNVATFRECWHYRFMVLDGTGII
ncbi:hypothetical protein X947_5801 [Burkholderia pseudomallei MSHR7334]|nr:hypothetical protein X947_5801 [Burkholderia pseudomallei MSHR7334]